MPLSRRLATLVVLLAFGCSAADPDHPSPRLDPGPHRGALRKVEGADGFVEVVTEPVRDAPAGSPKFRMVVYFLDRDQTGPMRPIPTGVSLTATWPDAPTAVAVDLTIEPAAGDPAGQARFVAPPAEHQGEPSGAVRGRLGDREVSAAL